MIFSHFDINKFIYLGQNLFSWDFFAYFFRFTIILSFVSLNFVLSYFIIATITAGIWIVVHYRSKKIRTYKDKIFFISTSIFDLLISIQDWFSETRDLEFMSTIFYPT